MNKQNIYKVIDELRETDASDMYIKDTLLNYLEANVDEFIECYEEGEVG